MNPITPHENEGRKYLLVGGLPIDATEIHFEHDKRMSYLFYDSQSSWSTAEEIHLPLAEYTLLGTIHTEGNALVFSEGFDPAPLVVETDRKRFVTNHETGSKWYESGWDIFGPVESVASLLESKGYTMLNPYGEKEPDETVTDIDDYGIVWEVPNNHYAGWRTSEDKRHKFKVAVIEVNQ